MNTIDTCIHAVTDSINEKLRLSRQIEISMALGNNSTDREKYTNIQNRRSLVGRQINELLSMRSKLENILVEDACPSFGE